MCIRDRIDVVSEIMLLEHRIQGVARGSIDVVERLTSIHYYYGENLIGDSRGLAVGLNIQGILLFDECLDGLGNRSVGVGVKVKLKRNGGARISRVQSRDDALISRLTEGVGEDEITRLEARLGIGRVVLESRHERALVVLELSLIHI